MKIRWAYARVGSIPTARTILSIFSIWSQDCETVRRRHEAELPSVAECEGLAEPTTRWPLFEPSGERPSPKLAQEAPFGTANIPAVRLVRSANHKGPFVPALAGVGHWTG
jgi:hypothetical protein